MSKETLEDLNTLTLIGMTRERGDAWHRRDDLQGSEDNHFPGFIPVGDVTRRLFHWAPQTAGVAYLVPSDPKVGDNAETPVVWIGGKRYRVVPSQQGRVGVLRGDNDYDMGVFKSDVVHRPYSELVRDAEKLTGTTLGISSAGLLAQGSRAWVELSMPETVHNTKTGVAFRPNLVKGDSMDGSLSNITFRCFQNVVCDNTFAAGIIEATASGQIFKRKHTSLSLPDLEEERDALNILEQSADAFTLGVQALIERELNPKQRIEVMDILVPLPKEQGRAQTLAANKRAGLNALDGDLMVSPWVGTAWGEIQRYNTYDHWFSNIKNTGRSERNSWMSINGKRAAADRSVIAAIEKVLA